MSKSLYILKRKKEKRKMLTMLRLLEIVGMSTRRPDVEEIRLDEKQSELRKVLRNGLSEEQKKKLLDYEWALEETECHIADREKMFAFSLGLAIGLEAQKFLRDNFEWE